MTNIDQKSDRFITFTIGEMDMGLAMLGIQEKGANIMKYYNNCEGSDYLDEQRG